MATKNSNGDFADFSQKTLDCLRAAGWTPNRVVSVDKYRTAFEEEGIALPGKVAAFLSRFGGLVITYTSRANRKDILDFLADEAVQGLGGQALHPYEETIQAGKLSPLGYFGGGTCLLMMAATGKVFGGVDWRLLRVGDTGPHAIENIISGHKMDVISDAPPSERD